MTDWNKLSLAMLVIGFELFVLAIINPMHVLAGEKGAVEAMMICGLFCYIVALILLMLIVFGELQGNRVATIFKVCFAFAACLFIVIGIAIYGARVNNNPNVYSVTVTALSAALALLSGVFCLLHLCRGRC